MGRGAVRIGVCISFTNVSFGNGFVNGYFGVKEELSVGSADFWIRRQCMYLDSNVVIFPRRSMQRIEKVAELQP